MMYKLTLLCYRIYMKFEVSHTDRSVIIALGTKEKEEKIPQSQLQMPDDDFFANAPREDLISFAKQAAFRALESIAAEEVMATKLALIISLLNGRADVRCAQSSEKDLDLFSEDLQIIEDENRLLLPLPQEVIDTQIKKPHYSRKELSGYHNVAEKIYTLDEEEIRILQESGFKVRDLGEDVSEFYQIINAVICVKVKRKKYAIREIATGEDSIITVKADPRFLPKTKVGDIFLGDACYKKYALHIPFNRYSQSLKLDGCNLSRQDFDRYHLQIYERLHNMEFLFEKKAKTSEVLYIDEVPTVTQKSKKKKNYIWIFNNNEFAWYRYFEGRGGEDPLSNFRTYKGYCMTDAYSSYPAYLHEATLCICLAHCRRRYIDYRKVTGSEADVKIPLDYFGQIYHEDGKLRDMYRSGEISEEEFFTRRNAICLPILEELKTWCTNCADTGYKRSIPLKRAVTYTLNNWNRIENIFQTAKIELDNNRSERLVKVIKLGSKNWITNGSEDGAKASSLMYSILETAKMYNLNPRDYLSYVFMKGGECIDWEISTEDLEPLMPWNVTQQDLSIVTDEYKFLAQNMLSTEEYEARMAKINSASI
ncbi:MAG: IS66 family transposase [Spirochaetia bacterium]|nr:IS66 family transposase [Spirochaetia bacterium]